MLREPIVFKKAMLDAKHEFEVDMERAGWHAGPADPRGSGAPAAAPPTPPGGPPPGPRQADGRHAPASRRRPTPRPSPTRSPARWRTSPTCATAARSRPRSTRPRRPTCSAGSDPASDPRARRAGYDTRDPRSQVPIGLQNAILPAAIVVAIMLLVGLPVHEFSHALRRLPAGRRHGEDVRAPDPQPDRPFRPDRRDLLA